MKKTFFSLSLIITISLSGIAQTINWDWQTIFQGSGANYPFSMAQDNNGNSFILGAFTDELILDTTSLNSGGNEHYYLAKIDASGSPVWLKDLFEWDLNIATDIDVSENGQVFVSGWKTGTGLRVLQLSTNGDSLSTISATNSGSADFNSIQSIEITTNGNIYIAGYYNSSFQLDTMNITSGTEDYCYFFIGMNSLGSVLFCKHGPTGDLINPFGVTNMQRDSSDNFYIGGTTIWNMDFGNGVTLVPTTSCPFIVKFNSSGTAQWAVGSSSLVQAELQDFAVTNSKIYATGMFCENFAIGGDTLNFPMESNIFFASFSTNGILDTLFSLSSIVPETFSTGYDHGVNIACDNDNNIYFSAMFGDTLYFGNDTLFPDLSYVSTYFVSDDYMVGKYDSLFQPVWAYTIGNIENRHGWGDLYSNEQGDIYFVGVYLDSSKSATDKSFIAKRGSGTVGIESQEESIKATLKAYPNPVIENITIELLDKTDKISNYEVYSIDGKLMHSGKPGNYKAQINMSSFNKGYYIIKATSKKGNAVNAKVLKQ